MFSVASFLDPTGTGLGLSLSEFINLPSVVPIYTGMLSTQRGGAGYETIQLAIVWQ